MIAKCPKCEKSLLSLSINGHDGSVFLGTTWKCITLCCPYCNSVLGAQIDPIAIKTDTVNELVNALRGR